MSDIQIMKALSLWQPLASLLACEAKKYETRSWATKYRGPIAIHAAAASVKSILKRAFPLGEWSYAPDYHMKREFLNAAGKVFEDYASIEDVEDYLEELPLGCVIATGELVGCHKIGKGESGVFIEPGNGWRTRYITGNELLFGDWTPGRYAWEFANMQLLPEPIPVRGKQGLWNWERVA